jgi:hypothetical protein
MLPATAGYRLNDLQMSGRAAEQLVVRAVNQPRRRHGPSRGGRHGRPGNAGGQKEQSAGCELRQVSNFCRYRKYCSAGPGVKLPQAPF